MTSATSDGGGQITRPDPSIGRLQGADCFVVDATVTTNGVGNGTVHVSEAAVSSTALVAVDGGGDAFVTETYNH